MSPPLPEGQLTKCALLISTIEIVAFVIATLGFLWGTKVVLVCFIAKINGVDYWILTSILAVGIIGHWRTIYGVTMVTFEGRVGQRWVIVSRFFGLWFQPIVAIVCLFAAMMRFLLIQNYDEMSTDVEIINMNRSLNIFYSLVILSASLSIIAKGYWIWEIELREVLRQVNNELCLEEPGIYFTRRFFHTSYSNCMNGRFFIGLKMDMISFAKDLLESTSKDDRLMGLRVLWKFCTRSIPLLEEKVYDAIGTHYSFISIIFGMLNWKLNENNNIYYPALEILTNLSQNQPTRLLIAKIPGAMEYIYTLLPTGFKPIDVPIKIFWFEISASANEDPLGVMILDFLNKLAVDNETRVLIGNTHHLLTKLIDLIYVQKRLMKEESSMSLDIVRGSLRVVHFLASTSGKEGNQLRKDMMNIVYTISSIRDILMYGKKKWILQLWALEILYDLALEEESYDKIARTGGFIDILFSIFIGEYEVKVRVAAGNVLSVLSLNKKICDEIIKLGNISILIALLFEHKLCGNPCIILRNLLLNCRGEIEELKELADVYPRMINNIYELRNHQRDKVVEVMIGALATYKGDWEMLWEKSNVGIGKNDFAKGLSRILKKHKIPFGGIRRYIIELAISMMVGDASLIECFNENKFVLRLIDVKNTTSDVENYHILSGSCGIHKNETEMISLVELATSFFSPQRNGSNNNDGTSSSSLSSSLELEMASINP